MLRIQYNYVSPTTDGGGIMFRGRLSGRCLLTSIWRDVISWTDFNKTCHKYFITWVGTAEKIFKVTGQRSRSFSI